MIVPAEFFPTEEEKIRKEIIRTNYQNAVDSGDKNVYLVDGGALTEICKDLGTVDNCHPNDLGFFSMATALRGVFKELSDSIEN